MTAGLEKRFYPPNSHLLGWLVIAGNKMPKHIADAMLANLFGALDVVVIGMTTELLFNALAYGLTRNPVFLCTLAPNVIVSATRFFVMRRVVQAQQLGKPTPTDAYMWSFICWCLIQGINAGLVMASNQPALQTIGAVILSAVTGVICVRQYPSIAFTMLLICLCDVPLMVGAAAAQDHWLRLLLILTPAYLVSNMSIVRGMQAIAQQTLQAQHENHLLARQDYLTGTLNRLGLMDLLSGLKQAGTREFAIFCLDLDGFKQVNDVHGHMVGDLLLKSVANRLAAAARPQDRLARLGGDEFLLLAPGMGPAEAAAMAVRLRGEITGTPHDLGTGSPVAVDVSAGFACAPQDGADFPSLYHAADARLYETKASHKAHPPAR